MGKSQMTTETPSRCHLSSMRTQSARRRKARSILATMTMSPLRSRPHNSLPAARSASGTLPDAASFQLPSGFWTGASWNQAMSPFKPLRSAARLIASRWASGEAACLSVLTRT